MEVLILNSLRGIRVVTISFGIGRVRLAIETCDSKAQTWYFFHCHLLATFIYFIRPRPFVLCLQLPLLFFPLFFLTYIMHQTHVTEPSSTFSFFSYCPPPSKTATEQCVQIMLTLYYFRKYIPR